MVEADIAGVKWTSPLDGIKPESAGPGHAVWKEIAPELTPSDFSHPHLMDAGYLRLLSKARRLAGVPFRFSSTYRTPEHNAEITGVDGQQGGARNSAHTEVPCCAGDLIVANREQRARVATACVLVGFRRLGIYRGNEKDGGIVHVDGSRTAPTPRIWTHY